MISRRIAIVATVIALVFLAGSIAETRLFSAGRLSIDEDTAGPVKLASPVLDLPGRPVPLTSGWRGRAAALLSDWTDAETQELLGPVRVAILWSDEPERSWLRVGSVCRFIFRHFGQTDSLVTIPGLDALTLRDMHVCMCMSPVDGREWFYVYQLPDPRCRTSALVFAKVPGKLHADAPDAEEVNSRIGGMKARSFNAIAASIDPDVACDDTVGSLARATVVGAIAGATCILLLMMILYRRSVG